MNVRLGVESDLCEIIDLYDDYLDGAMQTVVQLDMAVVESSILELIRAQALVVAETSEKTIGFIAGYFVPCNFSKDIMFSANYFYMRPDYRIYAHVFLNKVEEILKLTPATRIVMSSPRFDGCDRLDRFYQKLGFKQLEVHFYKDLKRSETPCPQI